MASTFVWYNKRLQRVGRHIMHGTAIISEGSAIAQTRMALKHFLVLQSRGAHHARALKDRWTCHASFIWCSERLQAHDAQRTGPPQQQGTMALPPLQGASPSDASCTAEGSAPVVA